MPLGMSALARWMYQLIVDCSMDMLYRVRTHRSCFPCRCGGFLLARGRRALQRKARACKTGALNIWLLYQINETANGPVLEVAE